MISQEQVKQLSQKYKISDSVIIREFIQITFLKELYSEKFSSQIFFKGGTAIRLLYGGQRFSEDLDFTVALNEKEFESNISQLFSKLKKRYSYTFNSRKTLAGKTYTLTASVPYFKKDLYIKLDFSLRENVLDPMKNILKTDYPIVIQNFIQSLSKDEIIAEKIRAILKRNKSRDLYDLWILQELGGKIDSNLITSKLKYYQEDFDTKKFLTRLDSFDSKDFVVDLRPFVPINEREKLSDLFEFVIAYLKNSFANI